MPDWDEIVRRDGPAAWRSAYRLTGNTADADECLQEALVVAVGIARREEVRCWRALLQRLASARALDRLRRRKRRGPFEVVADWGAIRGSMPSPDESAEEAELAARLREALGRIPPKQAEAFCLYALEGWSYAEVAEHLGASTDAVGVLLHRARGRLRGLLASSCPSGCASGSRKERS
jgi:RNA polymerase sigma factor (sigma-70 family)